MCPILTLIAGNARIQGMTEDLEMEDQDYNVALFTFFITYILFEVNLLLDHDDGVRLH